VIAKVTACCVTNIASTLAFRGAKGYRQEPRRVHLDLGCAEQTQRSQEWQHHRRELSLRPTLWQAQGKDGQRVKKTAGSSNLYYAFTHYEIASSTVTKYYFFAGQRIAMNKGGTLTYLHSDHPSTSSGQALAALC